MNFLVATLILLLAVGCNSSNEIGKARKAWDDRLNLEVEIGMTASDVISWGAKYDKQLVVEPITNRIFQRLESFDKSGFPCKDWFILLEVKFNENDQVASKKITETGTCL